jgi:glycosyltransferase involved in cell wall biosynthesis
MKILFNCVSSVSGGGRAYLRNLSGPLAETFSAEGQHDLVFLAHRDQSELLCRVPASNVIWISGPRHEGFRRIVWERSNLPRIVSDHRFDVLFTPYQIAPHVANVKNVLMIRNMEPFLFGRYKYSITTWMRNKILAAMSASCLRKANRVIAVSQFAANYLTRLDVPNEQIRTIYHGSPSLQQFDDEAADRLATLGITGDFILTCGSMLPYRRCEDVIRAFNSCLSGLPESTCLVIAGSGADVGYGRLIRDIIASSANPSRILLLGNVPWETMVELYRRCMLCAISTEIEACPNIALEAMAAGCAIVSSNRPPLPEMFDGCVLGYEARDVGNLSHQILRVVKDETLQRELSNKALLRAKDFSWSVCVEKTYSTLTDW